MNEAFINLSKIHEIISGKIVIIFNSIINVGLITPGITLIKVSYT